MAKQKTPKVGNGCDYAIKMRSRFAAKKKESSKRYSKKDRRRNKRRDNGSENEY